MCAASMFRRRILSHLARNSHAACLTVSPLANRHAAYIAANALVKQSLYAVELAFDSIAMNG